MYYRDGRNPYGSRGGYVRDSRRDFNYDYARRRDMGYDYNRMKREYDYPEYDYGYPERDYADYGYEHDYGEYDMVRDRRNYHKSRMLNEEDIENWTKKLLEQLDQKEKPLFKMDDVIKKAEAMGIRFDKVTPYEFYVTVLMMLTDYKKSIASFSPEMYIKLAKDWLYDEDSSLKYGEKLAAYYNHIINEF